MKRMLVALLLLTACGKIRTGAGPVLQPGDGLELVVAASDYTTGLLLGVRPADGSRLPEVPIHSDAVVRTALGRRYVVNRLGQDNIQIVERDGTTTAQFSVGRGTNPQDIAVIDEQTAYVSRFRSKTLLKVGLPQGNDIGDGVDFSELADGDGYPELTWMRRKETNLYVVVQRIDTAHGWVPTDASYVTRVDLNTDRIAAKAKLNFLNPVTALKSGPEGSIYVGCAGKLGPGTFDGGIERVGDSAEIVIREAALGGDILDFEILSASRGVAVIAAGATTRLVEFNPATGKFSKVWTQSTGYHLQEVLWDGTLLWVADRNPSGPRLRPYSPDGSEGTAFDLKLPPYHLELGP